MSWIEKLQKRWNVQSGWQVGVILVVFACTGFTVMYTKRWIATMLGFDEQTATWLKWSLNLVVILPLYQVVLLGYGWLFGQFEFFWNFEKRMFKRLASLFVRKNS
jgi:hypothetical protein